MSNVTNSLAFATFAEVEPINEKASNKSTVVQLYKVKNKDALEAHVLKDGVLQSASLICMNDDDDGYSIKRQVFFTLANIDDKMRAATRTAIFKTLSVAAARRHLA